MIDAARFDQYLDSLIAGRKDACEAQVSLLVEEGVPLRELYEQLFRDSLYEVGRRWEAGELSVAVEHQATAITEGILSELFPATTSRKALGRRAVVSATAGEFHQVGARIVADSLELLGWDVHFVGAGASVDELLEVVTEGRPDLLALSVSLDGNLPTVVTTVQRVQARCPTVRVVVGGRAVREGHDAELRTLPGTTCLHSLTALEDLVRRYPW